MEYNIFWKAGIDIPRSDPPLVYRWDSDGSRHRHRPSQTAEMRDWLPRAGPQGHRDRVRTITPAFQRGGRP